MNLAWWQIAVGAVVGLIILTVIVVIHELGHAITARRNGVEVEEFGIGFPPRAILLGTYKGTKVTLNWLPLGGFCKMKGESDDATDKGSYGAASLWAKTKILLAGVWLNFWTAVVIFTILIWFGMPKLLPDQFYVREDNHGSNGVVQIVKVMPNSVAEHSGFRAGDTIVRIGQTRIEASSEVPKLVRDHDKKLDLIVRRDGREQLIQAQFAARGEMLGISTKNAKAAEIKATWSAPLVALIDTLQLMWQTLMGIIGMLGQLCMALFNLLAGRKASPAVAAVTENVAGPIGILGVIFPEALAGGGLTLLYISGIIALSLAVMNLLPIPGLDGGRCYLTWLYHALGKPLTKEKETKIVGYGMMTLFAIMILVTIADIAKLF